MAANVQKTISGYDDGSTDIASGSVTLAQMVTIADQKILGNLSGGTASPSALSVTGTGNVVLATSPVISLNTASTAVTQTPGTNNTTIANTAFVTAAITGLAPIGACKYKTIAALPAGTYSNGASGVGATFTVTATGVLSIDGVNPALGSRILVNNQASTFQNGIYTITTAGAIGVQAVLTRATDYDTSSEILTGDTVFVTAGSTMANTTWALNSADNPVVGTDPITFTQTAGQGSFTAGNGITITGVSIAIDTSVTVDKNTAQVLTNKDLTSGTNTFAIPVASGITGLGTGVATALAVNTGSAGAIVLFNGALGAPSSGSLSSCTGLPLSTGVTGVLGGANIDYNTTNLQVTASQLNTIQDINTTASPLFTALTLGQNSGVTGSISFKGSSSGTTVFTAAATAGGTITIPNATGTMIVGAGANTQVATFTSAQTITSSTALTLSSSVFTVSSTVLNGDVISRASNTSATAAGRAKVRAITTAIVDLTSYGASYTTAGLLVAGLTSIESTSTVGLLHNIGSGGNYWWNINSTSAYTMNLTPLILTLQANTAGICKTLVTQSDSGTASQAQHQISNGTSSATFTILGTGFTTSGINVADLAKVVTTSTIGMAFQLSTAATTYWWNIGGNAAANTVMTLDTTTLTLSDAVNIAVNATTGTKIGTATSQKLAFYNSTPIVQPGATTDLGTVLSNLGLRAAGTAYPITTTGQTKFSLATQYLSTGGAAVVGNAVLVGGTVTVNTTAATATCIVLLTRKTSGGTIGTAITYAISAGNSFTITSDSILDTSTFSWHIVETY